MARTGPEQSEQSLGEIDVTRRQWVGLTVVLTGAAGVVVGSLGSWARGGSVSDGDVVNTTERHWMVGAAIALGVVAVLLAIWQTRAAMRLGWIRFVAWLHVALVVGVSTLDSRRSARSKTV